MFLDLIRPDPLKDKEGGPAELRATPQPALNNKTSLRHTLGLVTSHQSPIQARPLVRGIDALSTPSAASSLSLTPLSFNTVVAAWWQGKGGQRKE